MSVIIVVHIFLIWKRCSTQSCTLCVGFIVIGDPLAKTKIRVATPGIKVIIPSCSHDSVQSEETSYFASCQGSHFILSVNKGVSIDITQPMYKENATFDLVQHTSLEMEVCT